MTSSTDVKVDILPSTTSVGQVRLRVADLERSLNFYRDALGFEVTINERGAALLAGSDGETLVELREIPGIGGAPRAAAGLYHFAVLLPSRKALARFAKHLIEHGIRFGQSDHAVSEALYFDDPDGNGIEVYADRPRATWPVSEGVVHFASDPIDLRNLLEEIADADDSWEEMPAGTRIGHVHLRVSDLERSQAFYECLGFELTADYLRGARFVSAGGYHHHLGMNILESRGRPLANDDVAGLDSFTVVLPDRDSWAAAVKRIGAEVPNSPVYRAHDPDGIAFDLVYGD
jgi:catechol 2,3-dioxygenase